jgi:hypothetical protein
MQITFSKPIAIKTTHKSHDEARDASAFERQGKEKLP